MVVSKALLPMSEKKTLPIKKKTLDNLNIPVLVFHGCYDPNQNQTNFQHLKIKFHRERNKS